MSDLIKYNRKPDTLQEEMVTTVVTTAEISAKPYSTMYNGLSLLKTPPEIQAAIRQGNLPVSRGHLLSANLECPDLRNSLWFMFLQITQLP
jgi:hypothetical protein